MTTQSMKTVLVLGASRGLGLAIAQTYLERGCRVIGTVRGERRTELHDLRDRTDARLEIESLDITNAAEVGKLRERLRDTRLDVLLVNAGVKNDDRETIADVTTDEFVRVMLTNALAPMRAIETLGDLVRPGGTIAIMSSGQGSVSNNERGGFEVYRASKAALNMLMRSYAARHAEDDRTLLLLAPGWVRTGVGGPQAPMGVEESIPKLVDTIESRHGTRGLRYVDYEGRTVPW